MADAESRDYVGIMDLPYEQRGAVYAVGMWSGTWPFGKIRVTAGGLGIGVPGTPRMFGENWVETAWSGVRRIEFRRRRFLILAPRLRFYLARRMPPYIDFLTSDFAFVLRALDAAGVSVQRES